MTRALILIAACLLMCGISGADMVATLEPSGYLSWTGGAASGYITVEYYRDQSPYRSWSDLVIVTNSGAESQSLSLPWAYRLMSSTSAIAADATNTVPSSWSRVSAIEDGPSLSWVNYDSTDYALGWRYSPTDTVWQLSWAPMQNIAGSETGLVRVPLWFDLFLRAQGVSTPVMMRAIPGTPFVMGDNSGLPDERPERTVRVTRYDIDETEITEDQWEFVRTWATSNGYSDLPIGTRSGTNYPVRGICWHDAAKWLNARSEMALEIPSYRTTAGAVYRSGTSGVDRVESYGYRLPTEAEWEKAARGTAGHSSYPWGNSPYTVWASGVDGSTNYVYTTNSLATFRGHGRLRAVASLCSTGWTVGSATDLEGYRAASAYTDANGYGLRDIVGNVWELCDDWYAFGYDSETNDPTGPSTGSRKVIRGGSYASKVEEIRVSRRAAIDPLSRNRGIGLRAVKRPWPNPDGSAMLVVWNTNSAESLALKDYYLATRPGIANAYTLGVGCTTNEIMQASDVAAQIVDPVLSVVGSNASIRYVVLLKDVPTRTTGDGYSWPVAYWISGDGSTPYKAVKTRYLRAAYPGTRAIVTHITSRSLADCTAYVARISARYDGVYNTLSGAVANAWYVLDDGTNAIGSDILLSRSNYLRAASSTALIRYVPTNSPHITVWSNLTAYASWGVHAGWSAGWSTNGTVTFAGTNWYILQSIESFNGQLWSGLQGSYGDWFSRTAFGSTNWEHCPVGAVAHTEEPYLSGINTYLFQELWARGLPFGDIAWSSVGVTPYMIAIGDPWVCK